MNLSLLGSGPLEVECSLGAITCSHHCSGEKGAAIRGLHVPPHVLLYGAYMSPRWREEESRILSWNPALKIDEVSNFVCYLAYFSSGESFQVSFLVLIGLF